ncbi:hypothetical protein ALC62_04082 [Cyphomyrmex costatus]|uniref:Uncharacterized protein n=1 Tax=Cyphomyrmex costatus TaxID=456900 RepID=A0A151IKM3_9HYME|nr:hypothetical protein ALC62_04082 [Cyphomyrmex costatus]
MVTKKTFIASRSFVVIDNHLSKRLAPDIREVHVVNRHSRNVRVFMSIYMQATCGLDILMDFRIMMDQGGTILFISAMMAPPRDYVEPTYLHTSAEEAPLLAGFLINVISRFRGKKSFTCRLLSYITLPGEEITVSFALVTPLFRP